MGTLRKSSSAKEKGSRSGSSNEALDSPQIAFERDCWRIDRSWRLFQTAHRGEKSDARNRSRKIKSHSGKQDLRRQNHKPAESESRHDRSPGDQTRNWKITRTRVSKLTFD